MPEHEASQIRNIALIGHRGAGKTSLNEALLFVAGATDRLGQVEAGNTVADFEPEEIARQMTVSTALCHLETDGVKVNLLDTPGYSDFMPDVQAACSVVETAILLLDGVAGVEVHTAKVLEAARDAGLVIVGFVGKLDKEHADFDKAVAGLQDELGCRAVPVLLPIGRETELRGVVDLLREQAILYQDGRGKRGPVPAEMAEAVAAARERLVEAIAEADDALIEKYLEGEALSESELAEGLRRALREGLFVPVAGGSARGAIGVDALLEFLRNSAPSPGDVAGRSGTDASGEATTRGPQDEETAAVVFKTIVDQFVGRLNLLRVYSGTLRSDSALLNATKGHRERIGQVYALRGKTQQPVAELGAGDMGAVAKLTDTTTGDALCDESAPVRFEQLSRVEGVYARSASAPTRADEEKLSEAMARLAEEDIAFGYQRDQDTGEMVVTGMGQLHLDIATDRLKRKFGVNVELGEPTIAYRETIQKTATAVARHKKQTGGRGQFGECALRLEPMERGAGFEFVNEIKGASIPNQYIPGVEKGALEAMREGVLAGCPVVDVRVAVYDGKDHPVDSSELAFKIAAGTAFKQAALEADPVLLEPIVDLEVTTPEEFLGDIISDLNGRRARVQGTASRGGNQVIACRVPLGEILNYEAQLRSMTQGRASYALKPSHYEEVPAHLAQRIIAERQRQKAE